MDKQASAGAITSEDADEHREAVRPWDLNIAQISLGRYRAETEYVALDGVLAYREHCSRRLSITGATPAGFLILGSPFSVEARIHWCGGEIHSGRLAVGKPSSEVDILISEDSRYVVLLVREDLVLKHLGEKLGSRVLASENQHVDCHPSVGDSFVRTIHYLVDRFIEYPESLADPDTRNAIMSQLMEVLFDAVDSTETAGARVSVRERRLALHRALKYAADLRQPLAVVDLATAAGVSRRTLELAFKESLQVSPLKYMRWSRMNGARRDLKAATPDSAQVKGIAAQWGFSEAGRFAVDYGRLFGESPTETLRRRVRPLPKRLENALRA